MEPSRRKDVNLIGVVPQALRDGRADHVYPAKRLRRGDRWKDGGRRRCSTRGPRRLGLRLWIAALDEGSGALSTLVGGGGLTTFEGRDRPGSDEGQTNEQQANPRP